MAQQANQWAVSSGASVPPTLLEAKLPNLLHQAAQGTKGIHYHTSDGNVTIQTYAALLDAAQRVLQGLRTQGLQPQDRVILHGGPQTLLTAFWGCVLGGFVPVPIAVAPDYTTETSKTAVLRHAAELLDHAVIVTEAALQTVVQQYCDRVGLTSIVLPIESLLVHPAATDFHLADLEDLALISFTSGSTGVPKGVMLNGRNMLVVAYGMATVNRLDADSVSLNWMPLEHVASLVMFHVTQVYLGCQQIQVASERILPDPLHWLDLVHQYRVSHTWAPNFAYGLINERDAEVAERAWDLSCLRWMGNGAEAVVGKTTRRFLELLMPLGLGATVVSPGYGMSETCSGIVHSHRFSLQTSSDQDAFVEVGLPTPGVSLRIVDDANQVLPEGAIGRLQVQGLTVMQGYYQRPDLTDHVFTPDGWFDTGDLGFLQSGRLTLTGRQKEQIVINGVNYYSHEVEAAVEELAGVEVSFTAACAVRRPADTTDQLVIFFVPVTSDSGSLPDLIKAIRRQVVQLIGIAPSVVVPVSTSEIPKTNLGKIQRRQLAERFAAGEFEDRIQQMQQAASSAPEPLSQLEQQIAQIWQAVLGLPVVSIRDNFFELGGTSLLLMQVLQRLQQAGHQLSAVTLFQHPTIAALANHLRQSRSNLVKQSSRPSPLRSADGTTGTTDIAVIGMSCRFPGANTIEQFWQNLCDGVESIQFFSDAEILASGVDPHLLQHSNYVKASPILDCDITTFDAEFFGYSPKEASLLDPQQRLLLECVWESLEDAGYNPLSYTNRIGLYAGAAMNTYLLNHVYPNRSQLDEHDSLQVLTLSSMGGFQLTTANDKDYLTTRVSYKLNLTGPSVNVQTACSTSLVAVHLARQSLLNGECEIALAAGVSVHTPQKVGHLYQDGMILSPDGHCRAFDAKAAGTIFGSGAGVVVLKRLDQAMADGDRIYAVIKGSAIGNDGSEKVGYFAPQAAGQARVTAEALAAAGVEPATIGYVEAHGTGTALGDPIELAGLTQAFVTDSADTQNQRCAIGSVKTNVGHLNIASGIVGLIKTVLCLHHKQIPPSLHFETPNPQIDFASSPFYVNTQFQEWQSESIRRASVNSLGIGGTNAHVVLEEAPKLQRNEIKELRPTHYLFTLSAKSEIALRQLGQQYAEFLASHPGLPLADVCFTASAGRAHFQHRLSIVADSLAELQQKLTNWIAGQATDFMSTQIQNTASQPIAFLFAGQGCQYAGMGQELYQSSPVFRATLDRCDAILQPELGRSILEIIWTGEALDQTIYTQPALFAIEYALAQLWISWGISPTIVIGHSVGEYVAACIAGVFSLEDGLKLIAARGRLIQSLPTGAMAAVMANEEQVQTAICNFGNKVTIVAVNSEENVVIAGSVAAVEQAIKWLTAQGYKTKLLTVSHAFHSPLMQPIMAEFAQVASQVQYRLPQIELISNLTGAATAAIASPEYWCQHLRQPVRFADGMTTLRESGCKVLLECSPKPLLLGIAQTDARYSDALFIPSLSPNRTNWHSLCYGLSHLYSYGIDINWNAFYSAASHHRLSLPSYPFQRQRHWLDIPSSSLLPAPSSFHPLLGQKVRTPLKATLFQTQLSANAPAFLSEHRVQQRAIVPASAFVEMALAGAKSVLKSSCIRLENVTIPQALALSNSLQTVQLVIDKEAKPSFEIYSLADAETEDWTLHCSGQIDCSTELDQSNDTKLRDLNQLQQSFPYRYSAAEHYQRCQSQGLGYGASFQAVRQIWWREGEALGEIRLPASILSEVIAYCVHPVLLDAAFQVIAALLPDHAQSFTYIPVELQQLDWLSPVLSAETYWSYVRLHSQPNSHNHNPKFLTADIELLDQSGNLIAKIEHLKLQRLNQLDYQFNQQLNQQPSLDWRNWLYQVDWQLRSVDFDAAANSPDGLWLIFADRQGVAEQLAAQLRRVDQPYQLVFSGAAKNSKEAIYLNSSDPTAFEQLLVQLGQQTSLRGVIHLWSLDCPNIELEESHGKAAISAVKPCCESALYLMQALTRVVLPRLPDCWFVTCGAQNVGDRITTQPLQSCLWGLGKSFALEHPEFSTVLIDLDPNDLKQAALELFDEIQSGRTEEQVGFCRDKRYVARLVRLQQAQLLETQTNPTRLGITQRGTLENLSWQSVKRQPPAPDQVEIRVQATGLNFRDLLNALDEYPGEAGLLGLECAGEVVAVGSEVTDFAIGDAVVAIAAGSFSQFITVDSVLVARIPAGLDFAAAATIPTAFLTAFHALVELAQIKAGERVLIHAAAGGVGQAAIQIAQQTGAEVLATAAPEKWSLLKAQGIQHVFNSREFDADVVMNATGNQGVDVVLNSLTGETIRQSLSVLRPRGRFVEIGKTDVWQPAQVAEARPDIKYFLVDLFELTQQQPERIQAMLKQLLPQFQTQRLKPLPQTVFPATQAIDAFRYMQQAKQIGKIVIRQPEICQSNSLAPLTRFQIRKDGVYLITGGLGGLGLQLAEWLISRGAAHLILVNRSAPSASVQTTLEQWQQRATIDVIQADISDATEAANLLSTSPSPLLGIFHAAGTLADTALEQQTWEHFETVMAAKVEGAWNLHCLTREMQLDCFVLFSSAASLIGSAGQANYAAANAFLDALAHYRQQLKLPSLSINWGGWSQVGMVAERQLESEMVANGLGTIPPEQGLAALEYLLNQSTVQAGVLPIDWSNWQAPAAAFFNEVAQSPQLKPPMKPSTMQPLLQLKHLSSSECRSQLITYLSTQVGKILGIEAATIDPQQGLTEIGIDSLTSVELRNLLQTNLNCRLSSTLLFDYPTIAGLAEHLTNLLQPETAQPLQTAHPEADIAQLSEAEAEALLLQELEQFEN